MSSSPTTSLNPDVTLSLTLSSHHHTLKPEERGIKLIHLLLACANHASSGNLQRADACLRKISGLASVSGDSMQRLAARFASALAVRLVRRWPGLYKALNHAGPTRVEMEKALSIYAQAFPYLGFTYAIITRVLLQSMSEERVIHIVDLGSGDPKLWIPLLRSCAKTSHGPPPPQMKITCVHSDKVVLDKLGAKLVEEADSLDMAFQFNPVNVSLRELTKEMLKVRSGEALAFTSILKLHTLLAEDDDRVGVGFNKNDGIKDSGQIISDFLGMVHSMLPKVVLLIEQESDHNSSRLVDRFVEGLHYYSALFDSIDATFGGGGGERVMLEEMFGKEIVDIVACDGVEREERHEKYAKWMVRFGGAGFKPVRLWHATMEDARRLVEAYGLEGYKIISQRASLMICWHDRPIYSVSAWNC